MSSEFNDPITFKQPVTLEGGVTLPPSTAPATTVRAAMVQYATKAFVLANITAGLLTFTNGTDIPANAIVLGAYIQTTTQPGFSAGTTTGVSAKIGTAADDDGFGQSIAIGGAIGLKVPEPGARLGALNTTQNVVVAFVATGGTPQLSEVNAGAGIVRIAYALAPTS